MYILLSSKQVQNYVLVTMNVDVVNVTNISCFLCVQRMVCVIAMWSTSFKHVVTLQHLLANYTIKYLVAVAHTQQNITTWEIIMCT